MTGDGDRMARAGSYVLGLMDDDERERAERDLEIDPAFRDAMMVIAERMHIFDRAPADRTNLLARRRTDGWRQIKERIDAMPQMRPAPEPEPVPPEPAELRPQVTFGRRRSDRMRDTIIRRRQPKPSGQACIRLQAAGRLCWRSA